jgi:hypothetical protein
MMWMAGHCTIAVSKFDKKTTKIIFLDYIELQFSHVELRSHLLPLYNGKLSSNFTLILNCIQIFSLLYWKQLKTKHSTVERLNNRYIHKANLI